MKDLEEDLQAFGIKFEGRGGMGEAGGSRRSAQQTDAWVWPSSSSCVPSVETQILSIVPPGHPCRFPFPWFSFFFLRFSSPFCRSPCSPSFFVLSFFRLFLAPPSSFFFRFPAFLGGGFCYSVISSWCHTPLALLASLK